MLCYECVEVGSQHEAIGLCHHCSIALCEHHGHVIVHPVTRILPLLREVALPKSARLLLCSTCLAAISQVRECHTTDRKEIASRERAGVR